jgi:regulator of RNase E activity RraB
MGKQWDYFHRITEQREHMSVLVDASYSGTAPLPGFTRLLSVVVNLYAIATDKEERDIAQAKLGILERRLEALFSEHIQALYIGRINTETRLEFYYYAEPGGEPHQKLAETVMADYPKYRWVAAERDDAEWTFYAYLRPNDIEKLYAKNNILLQSLSQKGDRLDIARDVFHWLRFGSSENLRSAADSAKRLGYSVVNSDMDADKPTYQHTLIISKNQSLGVEVMNESVRELYDLTNTFSGKYEGWGTDIRQKLWRKLKSGITGKRIAFAGLLLLAVALIAVPLIMAKYI